MTLTREDIAVIEKIVRQSWYTEADPQQARFGTWLDVDQDQALALLRMIPDRLPVTIEPWPIPVVPKVIP